MKRYKLLTQEGYDSFKVGEIYEEGDTFFFATIRDFVNEYPSDWEEVIETDEGVVNKLVSEYWFDEEGAKEFLNKFKETKELLNIEITIYQAVDLINYFK